MYETRELRHNKITSGEMVIEVNCMQDLDGSIGAAEESTGGGC